MIHALRALWKGGWVCWEGDYYQVPEMMIEPHPPTPVPIYCGGESGPALRRAAQHCDGWVGTAYEWDDAVTMIDKLRTSLRDYGREAEPFEIIIALRGVPSSDLYKRAEDIGVTGVMCAPWAGVDTAGAGRFRAPIEQFAEKIMAHCG